MSKLKYYDGTDWKIVNGQVTGDTLPIGAIVPFGGWDAPTGWLICDGTLLNKTAYPELFNAIGYSFGGEDGGATFGLPDLRGRVPVGEKDNDSDFDGMGVTGGEKTHTLTVAEMPSHNHAQSLSGGSILNQGNAAYSWSVPEYQYSYSGGDLANYTGGGQAHNNLQPYQTVNYIIKAKQSAGLVANVSKTYSTSQSDTYSCDFINDCNLYSTTETFTGKYWINGKPIYRVCKNVGYLPNNSRIVPEFTGLMPLGSTITHLDGICHRFASDIHDYRPVSDCVITYLFRTTDDTPKLFIDTNQDMSAWECIAIVEYTKP